MQRVLHWHLHPAAALRQLAKHFAAGLEATCNRMLMRLTHPDLVRVCGNAVQCVLKRWVLQQRTHKRKALPQRHGIMARIGHGIEQRRGAQLLQQIDRVRRDVLHHLLVVGLVRELA